MQCNRTLGLIGPIFTLGPDKTTPQRFGGECYGTFSRGCSILATSLDGKAKPRLATNLLAVQKRDTFARFSRTWFSGVVCMMLFEGSIPSQIRKTSSDSIRGKHKRCAWDNSLTERLPDDRCPYPISGSFFRMVRLIQQPLV